MPINKQDLTSKGTESIIHTIQTEKNRQQKEFFKPYCKIYDIIIQAWKTRKKEQIKN